MGGSQSVIYLQPQRSPFEEVAQIDFTSTFPIFPILMGYALVEVQVRLPLNLSVYVRPGVETASHHQCVVLQLSFEVECGHQHQLLTYTLLATYAVVQSPPAASLMNDAGPSAGGASGPDFQGGGGHKRSNGGSDNAAPGDASATDEHAAKRPRNLQHAFQMCWAAFPDEYESAFKAIIQGSLVRAVGVFIHDRWLIVWCWS